MLENLTVWQHDATHCDICEKNLMRYFYDGKTQWGTWAVMCTECWFFYGLGVGIGAGDLYMRVTDDWIKIETSQIQEVNLTVSI